MTAEKLGNPLSGRRQETGLIWLKQQLRRPCLEQVRFLNAKTLTWSFDFIDEN